MISLYDKLITEILDKMRWRITDNDSHFVKDSDGVDKAITKTILKVGVAKFAVLDFKHGSLIMKDPNDRNLENRPPEDFEYAIF